MADDGEGEGKVVREEDGKLVYAMTDDDTLAALAFGRQTLAAATACMPEALVKGDVAAQQSWVILMAIEAAAWLMASAMEAIAAELLPDDGGEPDELAKLKRGMLRGELMRDFVKEAASSINKRAQVLHLQSCRGCRERVAAEGHDVAKILADAGIGVTDAGVPASKLN